MVKKTNKKNEKMDSAKDTMKLGIGSMAGMGAMGAMGAIPGMPAEAKGIIPIAGAGMQLANVGQMVKTTNTVVGVIDNKPKPKTKTSSKNDDRLRRMLGK